MRKRRLKFSWLVGASVAGLAAIVFLGFFDYLRKDDVETAADKVLIYSMIVLVSVLVGASIVFEVVRHFDPRKEDPDDLSGGEVDIDKPSSE